MNVDVRVQGRLSAGVAHATTHFAKQGGFLPGHHYATTSLYPSQPSPIEEQVGVQFRAEMFNAFNHAQFSNPNSNTGSGNFGLIGSARAPRLVQFGLKVLF